jgi:sec-independent protein translocase protein TatA
MFEGLFQPMHLLIILAIALIIFGPRRLPELGAGLGKSLREFKKAMQDVNQETDVKPEPAKEITSAAAMEMKQETVSKETAEVKKETPV